MKVLIMADRVAGIALFGDMNVVEYYGVVAVSLNIFYSNLLNIYNLYSESSHTVLNRDERIDCNII